MKYRSRSDIIATILREAMRGGATRTRLMYGAFLSYWQLKEYLQFLQEKNLLISEQSSRFYKVTEKGERFLRGYDEMHSLMKDSSEKSGRNSALFLGRP